MDDMHLLTLHQPDHGTAISSITLKPSRLLTLPGEIRNKIWRMLLTTPYAFQEPTSPGGCEAHYELAPAILAVNHQIHDETHRILREENKWIFVCISMPKTPFHYIADTVNLPVVSRSILTDALEIKNCYLGMQSHALNVFLSPMHGLYDDECEFYTMLMGPESLPYLLQWIFAMLYTHASVPRPPKKEIQLSVGYPVCFTRLELQREILEPFLAARGARGSFIYGNADDDLASSLMAKMRHPFRHYTDQLGFSKTFLEKGDAAAAAGHTKAASFLYEQGNDFTFFAGQSCIDMHQPFYVHVYEFEPIASMLTAFDIRWAKTLLKLHCYADVQRLVATVLGREVQTQFQTTTVEKIRLVLYCALASLGLGETARFSQIMRALFRGTCDLGVFPTRTGSTADLRMWGVFRDKRDVVDSTKVILENLDELVSYCKEGEERGLRWMDTGEALPDRTQIEFPVEKEWSATATRYERRREKWARNSSVTSLI